jgi:hypothetical protein
VICPSGTYNILRPWRRLRALQLKLTSFCRRRTRFGPCASKRRDCANKIGVRGAVGFGIATAFVSVTAMLIAIGVVDKVPIVPDSLREWREAVEYALSIMLAYVTGNLLVMLLLRSLPNAMAASGRPSAVAVRLARMFGQHVGPEVLRRRARRIQELIKTLGPLAGLVATAGGSIYTGLKGVLGH